MEKNVTSCAPHNVLHTMEKDAIFETAESYIRFTGKSVYLTGKAKCQKYGEEILKITAEF